MADAQDTTITTPATTAAPAADTTVTTVAPVTETTAAAVETAPVTTETAPAVENVLGETAAPVEAKVELVTDVKKTDEKPVEKATESKVTETPPAETKVELPTYEPFKLPENVKLEGEQLGELTKLLAEVETGKLDHKGYQDFGQKLVDYGTKIVSDSITRLNDSYVQIHQSAVKARFDALKADPDMGGDKLPETISALQKSITEYGGSESQIAEFRKEVTESGLGASPAICRVLYNMQQKINKYTTEQGSGRNANGTDMVPAGNPAPNKVKDYQRFYQGGQA